MPTTSVGGEGPILRLRRLFNVMQRFLLRTTAGSPLLVSTTTPNGPCLSWSRAARSKYIKGKRELFAIRHEALVNADEPLAHRGPIIQRRVPGLLGR